MTQDRLGREWRPEILDEQIETDRVRVRELRADASIDVLDSLSDMRAELTKLVPKLSDALRDEPSRWIYYSWRRTLVATLGPLSFRRLRLDRNRNRITLADQEKLQGQRVGVVGQSVGHLVAHTLAMGGLCGELRLADFDRTELSNLNRVPATLLDLGINKAVVTARRVAELDPYIRVEVFDHGLTEQSMARFLDGLDLVLDECDSLDIKVMVREVARERGIPVLMATSDRGLFDVERFDLEPKRAIFHGVVGDLRAADLRGLSTRDKVPYVLRILEPDKMSAVVAASMAEIDQTITTWPQLAEDVTVGAASAAAAVRRIGVGERTESGRTRVDLDVVLGERTPPLAAAASQPPHSTANGATGAPTSTDPITAIMRAASLAPSGGNSQPWAFSINEGRFDLHLVPERTSTMDVAFRASYLCIGAALCNARIAAAAAGLLGPAEIFPAGPDGPVASLHLEPGTDPGLAAELPAMLDRCANRRPGVPAPLDPDPVAELTALVATEGAALRLLTDRAVIEDCAELLGQTDRLRYLTPHLHAEMMNELRWPGEDGLDTGLDVRTLELDAADLAKLSVIRRADVLAQLAQWGGGQVLGEPMRDSVRAASALAVVSMRGADPVDYVRVGSAVERLWIRAQAGGLGVQPVSPVFLYARGAADIESLVGTAYRGELAQLAEQFRSLSAVPEDEELALVLRLSHAPRPTVRSQRMSLTALLRPGSGRVPGLAADG